MMSLKKNVFDCIAIEVIFDCVSFNRIDSLQDVLYTICNNCGPVQRIVIFRKNGVQAMVEYPFSESEYHCLPSATAD